MRRSRRKLEPFRVHRLDALRQMVGHNYSDDGSADVVPVPMLGLAISTFGRSLTARNPRALVRTDVPEYKPGALSLQLALDELSATIKLGKELKRAAINGLFSLGAVKVGLESIGDVDGLDGETQNIQQPFAENIDLDDWVHDMSATSIDDAEFMGNRYRLPLEEVKENKSFNRQARQSIKSTPKQATNLDGDLRDETLSQGEEGFTDEFQDYVELYDIWIPSIQAVVTIPADDSLPLKPLRVIDWEGPSHGPYHILAFQEVPGNAMPLGPVTQWRDMDDFLNRMYRKIFRQAERQKDILAYQGGQAAKDAGRIQKASDGEIINVNNPKNMATMKHGGVDQRNLAIAIHSRELFKELAGNLDLVAGLGPQSQTATQDKLLAASAGKQLADMQDVFVDFTSDIMRSLAFYMWEDPIKETNIVKKIGGEDLFINTTESPDTRQGRFLDYRISIEPYSMQHRSPGERLQLLLQLVTQVLGPLQPQLQAQGVQTDMAKLMQIIAKYSDMTELTDILTNVDSLAQTESPSKPSVTQRTNTRISQPGKTPSGSERVMMEALVGANPQESELRQAVS